MHFQYFIGFIIYYYQLIRHRENIFSTACISQFMWDNHSAFHGNILVAVLNIELVLANSAIPFAVLRSNEKL